MVAPDVWAGHVSIRTNGGIVSVLLMVIATIGLCVADTEWAIASPPTYAPPPLSPAPAVSPTSALYAGRSSCVSDSTRAQGQGRRHVTCLNPIGGQSAGVRPNGLGPTSGTTVYDPAWCTDAQFGDANRHYTVHDRFRSCEVSYYAATLTEIDSSGPHVRGTAYFTAVQYDSLNYKTQQHIIRLRVWESNATGAALTSQGYLYSAIACYKSCTTKATNTPDKWTAVSKGQTLEADYTVAYTVVQPMLETASIRLSYRNNFDSQQSLSYVDLVQTPNLQCDKEPYMNGSAGCAFTQYVPIFKISLSDTRVAKSASAIYYAQVHLKDHWGANYTSSSGPIKGPPLSRVADAVSRSNNNKAACADFKPVNKGDTCDEYPFESTYQGAAFVGRGRVYVASVPATQNSAAGTQLGSFYLSQRVIQDSDFYVQVTN